MKNWATFGMRCTCCGKMTTVGCNVELIKEFIQDDNFMCDPCKRKQHELATIDNPSVELQPNSYCDACPYEYGRDCRKCIEEENNS